MTTISTPHIPAQTPFAWGRRAPINVLHMEAAMPLVTVGGKALQDLREDVFDAARNSSRNAPSFDTYTAALMGGEPFAIWR